MIHPSSKKNRHITGAPHSSGSISGPGKMNEEESLALKVLYIFVHFKNRFIQIFPRVMTSIYFRREVNGTRDFFFLEKYLLIAFFTHGTVITNPLIHGFDNLGISE